MPTRPWLTIWLRPRVTIRRILATPLGSWWFLALLAIAAGVGKGLRRAVANELGRSFSLLEVLGLASLWGTIVGLVGLLLGGAVLAGCLRIFNGRGSVRQVCAAVAWGWFPQAVVVLLWVPVVALLGHEMFLNDPFPAPNMLWARWLLSGFFLVDLVLVLWSLVIVIACVAEVAQVKVWRVLTASVLSLGLIYAGLIGFFAVTPRWLSTTELGFSRRAVREPLRSRGDVDPRWPMGRGDPRPPAELGPVALKIWEEGYAIRGSVEVNRPGRPVVALHLVSGNPGVKTDVVRYLPSFPELTQLSLFGGVPFTDEHLSPLRSLQHLKLFSIGGNTLVTDNGLLSLGSIPSLSDLRLVGCKRVTGERLGQHIPAQRLEKLFLYDCGITKKGVEAIGGLTSLRSLTIFIAQVDDASLAPLSRLEKLTRLELQSLPIDGSGLEHLLELPMLRELDLFGCDLTDEAVEPLCALSTLQKLNLEQTTLTQAQYERIQQALPKCRINYIRARARAK